MVIDFHTHIVPPKIKERRTDYLSHDPCFSLLYSNSKAKLVTADELIASMDEGRIDSSVVLNLGWVSHELCVETNDYILESVYRYPGRLIGFCTVQPKAGDVTIAELERCAKAGIRGLGEMRPDIQGFDLIDETMMKPVVEVAIKHNLIFLTHASEPVGHQYLGKGSITPNILYSFIAKFPSLKVVCAHWGGGLPFYALMPEVSEALANVFFDTAATPFLYHGKIFEQTMYLVGIDKVLFGSDYPLLSQKLVIEQVKSLSLPELAKEMILGGNAERLFGHGK